MFELIPLPYPYESLAPTMSAETLQFHHDKHHAAYVKVANEILADAPPEPLEAVMKKAKADGQKKLFNQTGQIWNHGFFWHSMTPDYAVPKGDLAKAIDETFGGLAGLKEKFVAEGVGHFGSGWVWLIHEGGSLKVISSHDADSAVMYPCTPLLVCDLWEHAYYIDKRNDRGGFLNAWFDGLANWAFAEEQYAAALGGKDGWRYPAPKA